MEIKQPSASARWWWWWWWWWCGDAQVWCRVLSFAKIYTTTCTYCWMFCEGFYLHQLISNTFEPPKSLTRLYLFGWRECCFHSCRLGGATCGIEFVPMWIKENTFSNNNNNIWLPALIVKTLQTLHRFDVCCYRCRSAVVEDVILAPLRWCNARLFD